jgi:hypothetical protein
MMMPLSPIERMIDAACGLQPGQLPAPQRKQPSIPAASQVLLDFWDAGKAWRARPTPPNRRKLLEIIKPGEELGM